MIEKFQPLEAWKPLPTSYTHFSAFKPFGEEDMRPLRDENYLRQAVDLAWNNLAMTIDQPHQNALFSHLKEDIQPLAHNEHQPRINRYWDDLKILSIFPFISDLRQTPTPSVDFGDHRLHDAAFGNYQGDYVSAYNRVQDNANLNSHMFTKLEKLTDNEELMKYIRTLKRLNAAHILTLRPIFQLTHFMDKINNGKSQLGIDNSREDVQKSLQVLWQNSDPYYKLSPVLNGVKQKQENALFGDQAEIAGTLWQTLIFARISTLDDLISPHLKQFREQYPNTFKARREKIRSGFYDLQTTAFKSLIEGDYEGAATQVMAMANKYPNIFPKFVVNNVTNDMPNIQTK